MPQGWVMPRGAGAWCFPGGREAELRTALTQGHVSSAGGDCHLLSCQVTTCFTLRGSVPVSPPPSPSLPPSLPRYAGGWEEV